MLLRFVNRCLRQCRFLCSAAQNLVVRDICSSVMISPQGTEVFPLLGSVLHDPEVFTQPEEFNPGRFLDADGRFKRQEAFLPFSLGIYWAGSCAPAGWGVRRLAQPYLPLSSREAHLPWGGPGTSGAVPSRHCHPAGLLPGEPVPSGCLESPASCQWPFQHPSSLPAASSAPLTSIPPHRVEQMKERVLGGSSLDLGPGQDRVQSYVYTTGNHTHTPVVAFESQLHRYSSTGPHSLTHTPIHNHKATQPHKLSIDINSVFLES